MTRVKICGITSERDATAAVAAGADAIGLVFAPSPRRVGLEQAARIVSSLPSLIKAVGVFVDAPLEEVRRTALSCGLGAVQLHGRESPGYCLSLAPLKVIKAFRVSGAEDIELLDGYPGCAHLMDSGQGPLPGGTGLPFDWSLAAGAAGRSGCLILAGGLDADNVRAALERVRPWAVDVSSGVEAAPGIKDAARMKRFVREVRKFDISMMGEEE